MKKQLQTLVFVAFCSILYPQDWPMINQNFQRTGYASDEEILLPPLQPEKLIDLGGIPSTMIVAGDILYYIRDGFAITLYAYRLDTDQELWHFTLPGGEGTAGLVPAVWDNLIFVGGQHGEALFALDRYSGEVIWSREVGDLYNHSPLPDGEGRLYLFADSLFCLNASDGTTIWSSTGNFNTPALFAGDLFYGNSEQIISCDASTGEINWARNQNNHASQIIANNQGIYSCNDTTVCSYYFDAYKKWCYPLPDGIQSLHFAEGNALLADSILVLTALNKTENVGMLLAINVNTGEKIWDYKSNARDFFNPAGANGIVYVTGGDPSTIKGFDITDGSLVFADSSRNFIRQPVIAGGKLYVPNYPGVMTFSSELSAFENLPYPVPFAYYPNPVTRHLQVKWTADNRERCTLKLTTMTGVQVKQIFLDGGQEYSWPMDDLPEGIYVLILTSHAVQKGYKIIKI